MRRARLHYRAFTLVEVAVTVVIIGILAVIAVVAYRRKIAATRTAEATHMITAIRRGQEEHKSETGVYANVTASITSFYPAATPGAHVTQWGGPCNVCGGDTNAWEKIKVHADGPVLFGYATTASIGAGLVSGGGGGPASMAAAGGPGGGGGGGGGSKNTGDKEVDDVINSQTAKIGPTDPVFIALAEADANEDGKKCHVLGISHSNNIVVTNEGD
jgi:prepilin-type N-terminal cleavage/methylation domain-containing protein